MSLNCAAPIDINDIESKYRLLFECVLDMVFLIDINGRIVDVNNAAVKGYGYARDELLSMNVKDLRIPGERSSAEKQLKDAFEKGAIYETVHLRENGSTMPVEISSRGLIINGSNLLIAIVRDITARKEADGKISRLAAIVKSSDEAILGITLEGIITDWNMSAEKMYGYTEKEMVGRSVEVLIPKNRMDELQKIVDMIKQGRTRKDYETERIRKDGKIIIVSLTVSPIKGDHGKILGISWIARDIMERKKEEFELKRKAILIDLSPDAIMVRMLNGTINFWSKGAESLYGWTQKEALGRKSQTLLKTEFPISLEAIIQQLMDTGYWSGELIHSTKDGKQVIVQSRWLARFFVDHTIWEILEANVDITEQKRAEEALMHAKAQSDMYLDLLGHDINNMNQIATGFLEIALGQLRLTGEERQLLEKPLESLKNSAALIENVRKLQKIGEGSLKNRKIDLCVILNEVKKDYSHIPDRSVTINFKPEPHCYVIANELIKDVFSNLVGNAIKHSDPRKPLTIDIGLDLIEVKGQGFYKVVVEDNGPGIPDNVKTKLFMRFQRGKTKANGKGLGLYLVRTLVTDYHGKIWVEDRVPGDYTKGSRFIVLLPTSD